MNESSKTIVFAAVAAAVGLVAWFSRPVPPGEGLIDLQGQSLCPKFTDPLLAASLEIIKYDKKTGEAMPFRVAQVDGHWSIPSRDNYPTDGKDQLVEAASAMTGLRIISVANSAEDLPDGEDAPTNARQIHNMYGVIDPDPKTLKPGDKGVGTRVTMKDGNGNALLSLVIGEEVAGENGVHYVRHVGKDPVFTVKVDTSKLSTSFADWIERNLLDINTFDIKEVRIQDYTMSVLRGQVFSQVEGQMTLEYDDAGDPKWKLVEDVVFDEKEGLAPVEMADDEELDTDKLNDLKFALDDLKIVDVNRKPPGLSADLKATGEFNKDRAGLISLQRRGFYVVQVQGSEDQPQFEVLSNKGEIRLLMKDGVEYLLRFGEIAGSAAGSGDEGEDEKEGEEASDESSDEDLNRYLFIMAKFNPDLITKPEPLSDETAAAEIDLSGATEPTEDKTAGEVVAETETGEEATAEETAAEKAEVGDNAEKVFDDAPGESTTEDSATAKDDEAKDDEAKDDEAKDDEAKDDEAKDDEAAERERLEKEQQREQEEYEEKLEKGRERVKKLNARFADWYYIISNDVYKKIHLSRGQIVKIKKEGDDDDEHADDHALHDETIADHAGHDHADHAGHDHAEEPEEELGLVDELKRLKSEGPEGSQ